MYRVYTTVGYSFSWVFGVRTHTQYVLERIYDTDVQTSNNYWSNKVTAVWTFPKPYVRKRMGL